MSVSLLRVVALLVVSLTAATVMAGAASSWPEGVEEGVSGEEAELELEAAVRGSASTSAWGRSADELALSGGATSLLAEGSSLLLVVAEELAAEAARCCFISRLESSQRGGDGSALADEEGD